MTARRPYWLTPEHFLMMLVCLLLQPFRKPMREWRSYVEMYKEMRWK